MFQTIIESLYEDNRTKIQGCKELLAMVKTKQSIIDLSVNTGVISALVRVLKEEYQKEYDLTYYILSLFKIFTSFSELQLIATDNKIGDICLKILDQEHIRMDKLKGMAKDQKVDQFEKKQWKLIEVSLDILYDLAFNLNFEVKMLNRDVLSHIKYLLPYQKIDLLLLKWLTKLSLLNDNRNELSTFEINIAFYLSSNEELLVLETLYLMNNMYLLTPKLFEPFIPKLKSMYNSGSKLIVEAINKILYNFFLLNINYLHSQFHSIIIGKYLVDRNNGDAYSKLNLQQTILCCSSETIFKNENILIPYCEKVLQRSELLHWTTLVQLTENEDISKKLIPQIPKLISLLQQQNDTIISHITSVLANLSYYSDNPAKIVKTYQLLPLFTAILDKCLKEDSLSVSKVVKDSTLSIIEWISCLSKERKLAEDFLINSIPQKLCILYDYFDTHHEKSIVTYCLFQLMLTPSICAVFRDMTGFLKLI